MYIINNVNDTPRVVDYDQSGLLCVTGKMKLCKSGGGGGWGGGGGGGWVRELGRIEARHS